MTTADCECTESARFCPVFAAELQAATGPRAEDGGELNSPRRAIRRNSYAVAGSETFTTSR
eukprot:CAMPEP_0181180444 /NCGR_PEP_ID=MMETSP1096-20121128/6804_1 /TAXON_ID=156174 ORGANISM="Chrysochromulina ericina, Strain CCMP281" /NCGR_SAMPLE_ID=MMETSP1096 /ASSEMBLY_ACC=CAM_ASM_000453 /LENGTH=60 /DNA_ID=CAMNT_0023268875 /DNA_START=768 /DNA_END=950 /DNA_ORIENTATION=-